MDGVYVSEMTRVSDSFGGNFEEFDSGWNARLTPRQLLLVLDCDRCNASHPSPVILMRGTEIKLNPSVVLATALCAVMLVACTKATETGPQPCRPCRKPPPITGPRWHPFSRCNSRLKRDPHQ